MNDADRTLDLETDLLENGDQIELAQLDLEDLRGPTERLKRSGQLPDIAFNAVVDYIAPVLGLLKHRDREAVLTELRLRDLKADQEKILRELNGSRE
jgi:hypothetical protein